MTALLTEGLVDALMEHLKEHLPERAVSLELVEPAAWFTGEKVLGDGVNYPAVFVLADSMTVERHNATFIDATHEVRIEVAVREADTADARRNLYRYMRAVWELIVHRYFEGPLSDYVVVAGDNHRGGIDPVIEYEEIPIEARNASGPKVMRAILRATFNKQEEM